MMKVKEFVERLLDAAENHVTLYVMGVLWGSHDARQQSPLYHKSQIQQRPGPGAMINAASADTFGFDCVCLIKGILWGWNGDASKFTAGPGMW